MSDAERSATTRRNESGLDIPRKMHWDAQMRAPKAEGSSYHEFRDRQSWQDVLRPGRVSGLVMLRQYSVFLIRDAARLRRRADE